MRPPALYRHLLLLLATAAGIAGMGLVFDAAVGGNLQELSLGVPPLFLGLWWAGRELGLSLSLHKARNRH